MHILPKYHFASNSKALLTVDPCVTFECCMAGYQTIATKFIIASSIMLMLTTLMLPAFIVITIQVSKLVWPKERAVPLMLGLLCTTLVSSMIFYIYLIVGFNNPQWWCKEHIGEKMQVFTCTESFYDNMPSFFLANAVILNLN